MRVLLLVMALIGLTAPVAGMAADEAAWNALREGGAVLVLRRVASAYGVRVAASVRV